MDSTKVKKVVIVGGGTAGWMTAASLAKLIGKNLDITLIESDEIGTVGVGEATIPTMMTLHQLLKINEQEFMSEVQATFKLGISFENWKNVDQAYIHSFGFTGQDCWAAGFQHFWLKGKERGISKEFGDYSVELQAAKANKFAVLPNNGLNYAYHIDASLYAKFLRRLAERHNTKRVEGKITVVNQHDNGDIKSVVLASGKIIQGDLFIDCSGFAGLLIEKTLNTEFEDWSQWLPCDSAIAVQTRSVRDPIPYTRAIARESGWQWRIPLQSRVGNGLVFCSKYLTDQEATQTLLSNLEGEVLTEPRVIKFRTGQRTQHWNRNCIALGLAGGFVEPLESTSIHLIQRGIIRLMQMFPFDGVVEPDVQEFNSQMKDEFYFIRDFIVMHYHLTERTDTEFWRHCKAMKIPDSLQHRLDLFKKTGRIFQQAGDVFAENSWSQVMLGQGLIPEHYHPIVDMMSDDELEQFLKKISISVEQTVSQLPSHQQFLSQYCPAKSI
ncbi:MAG: tryptophan 7-halogenase [Proteobacteria bacterium]|nr:tryptophan 7-halogenase [Pseudomonadota bacterium]MDA1351603.1 tryptophan 7-halogenase [Pseudomonadota bacterium]